MNKQSLSLTIFLTYIKQTQVHPSLGTAIYPHAWLVHTPAMATRHVYARWATMAWATRAIHPSQFVQFWASGGAKFPKMGDSMPWTLIKCLAKFDIASFILGEEISNHNHTNKKHTNSNVIVYRPVLQH